MNNKILATLVHDAGLQRFYQFSKHLALDSWGKPLVETIKHGINKIKNEFKPKSLTQTGIDKWDIFCISDAFTHTERLVFLATKFNNDKYGILGHPYVGGVMTLMMHGGDSETVLSDEMYLQQLAEANNYKFEGIKQ